MGQEGNYHVYILSSAIGGTLYVGVTKDLVRPVYEHKQKFAAGFTKRYAVDRLVYYEIFCEVRDRYRAGESDQKVE